MALLPGILHNTALLFWCAALVIFLVVEATTAGLTSIWFACGSLAALICAALNGPLWLQIVLFLAVSGATLWFTRPLVKRYINSRTQPTNADRVIGMVGRVLETIDPLTGTGTVSMDGKFWSARSDTGAPIPADTLVTALRIEGVRLIVAPIRDTASTE